ncbi:hypothetical protein GCM10027258_57670 [Amycolatopsis stemonae]
MSAYEERIGNPAFERRVRVAKEVDATFAARARQAREEQGMSQAALAHKLRNYGIHIDGTAITRIEKNATNDSGARTIRLAEALAISNALGKTLDDMLRPAPELSEQMRQVREELARITEAASYTKMRQAELAALLRDLEYKQELKDRLRNAEARLIDAKEWEHAAQSEMDSAAHALMTTREMTTDSAEIGRVQEALMQAETRFADASIAAEKAWIEYKEIRDKAESEL